MCDVDALHKCGLRGFDYLPWTIDADVPISLSHAQYHRQILHVAVGGDFVPGDVGQVWRNGRGMVPRWHVRSRVWRLCLSACQCDRGPFVRVYIDSDDCELTTLSSKYLSWERFFPNLA